MILLMVMVAALLVCTAGTVHAGGTSGLALATANQQGDHPGHIRQLLMKQYKKWAKTPYRSGGMSRKGVDCSGLVSMIFSHQFGIELPRTVRRQAHIGQKISKKNIEPGNLVFFKTGARSRHVGIYLGNYEFLHASAKKGVIVSSLKNPYWAPRLWKITKLK